MEEMAWGQLQSGSLERRFRTRGHLFDPMSLILFIFFLFVFHAHITIFCGLTRHKEYSRSGQTFH